MKKNLSLLAVFLISSWAVNAQSLDTRRHVEVDATARVSAEVDLANWHIKIRGEAPGLTEASKKLDESVAALKLRLTEAGILASSLRLSGITSGKHYEGNGNERRFKGYFAERTAVIGLTDLSKRQLLETVLLADDLIEIVMVDLRSSHHEALRKQVLLAAVSAAKEKAAALAKEAGAEIGIVLALHEGGTTVPWRGENDNRAINAAGADGPVEFEKLQYTATVTMKFELK